MLTLLAHDLTSVETAARVFDVLLSQNPVFVCYLAVAIVLAKKDEVAAMDAEDADDPSMLHSTLAKVPRLRSMSPEVSEEAMDESWDAANRLLDSDVWTPAFDEPEQPKRPEPVGVPVEPILEAALDLYRRFPVDHKAIAVDELLGPCSCVFTWSLDGSSPPGLSDEEAERVAKEGGPQIVKPAPVEEDPDADRLRRAAKRNKEREMQRRAAAQVAFALVGVAGVLLALYAPQVVLARSDFLRSFASTVVRKLSEL